MSLSSTETLHTAFCSSTERPALWRSREPALQAVASGALTTPACSRVTRGLIAA